MNNQGLSQDFIIVLQSQQELRFQFVLAEIDLAAVFIEIALNTSIDDRLRRNSRLAYVALGTANRFMKGRKLTSKMTQAINDRLRDLRPKLKELKMKASKRQVDLPVH